MKSTLQGFLNYACCTDIEKGEGILVPKDLIFLPNDKDPEVDFVCIGGHFKKHFLSSNTPIQPMLSRLIHGYDTDCAIDGNGNLLSSENLWNVENAVNIREVYYLLLKQKRGEYSGDLRVNGYRNLFCVIDMHGELCVVTVFYKHGWHIISRDVNNTNNLQYAGYPVHIFSAKELY